MQGPPVFIDISPEDQVNYTFQILISYTLRFTTLNI